MSKALDARLEFGPPLPRTPSVFFGSNRELMEHIAPLYLYRHSILDLTFGLGNWWSPRLHPDQCFTGDYTRRTLAADRSVDVVTYDPAYVVTGAKDKTTLDGHFERYGLDRAPTSMDRLVAAMARGQREAARIARRYVLQKCQQQVDWHAFHDLPRTMKEAAEAIGLVLVDEIIHARGLTAQPVRTPDGRLRTWRRAARAHSHLLVFEVPRPANATRVEPQGRLL